MNKKSIMFAMVLASSLGGEVFAQGVDTDVEVRAALTAQGYSDIHNVQRDDGGWSAQAKAPNNEDEVKLRVDAVGQVYPDPKASQLSEMDILASIAAAGYTNIDKVVFSGGLWKAQATSSTGKNVEVKVDPADGHVISESEE